MSSLAFDDAQEHAQGYQMASSIAPELHVVKPRHLSRKQRISSHHTSSSEDVVYVGGRFTVSF